MIKDKTQIYPNFFSRILNVVFTIISATLFISFHIELVNFIGD